MLVKEMSDDLREAVRNPGNQVVSYHARADRTPVAKRKYGTVPDRTGVIKYANVNVLDATPLGRTVWFVDDRKIDLILLCEDIISLRVRDTAPSQGNNDLVTAKC